MEEDSLIQSKSIEKNNQQQQQQIQLKLSAIFKQKVVDTPQTFRSFIMLTEKNIVQFLFYQSI